MIHQLSKQLKFMNTTNSDTLQLDRIKCLKAIAKETNCNRILSGVLVSLKEYKISGTQDPLFNHVIDIRNIVLRKKFAHYNKH